MTPAQEKEIALVQHHLDELGEHFDTVQIFCTRHEPGTADGTINVNMGTGNWFARFGHVQYWVIRQTEHERVNIQEERRGES